jgi:hypothetical protein
MEKWSASKLAEETNIHAQVERACRKARQVVAMYDDSCPPVGFREKRGLEIAQALLDLVAHYE